MKEELFSVPSVQGFMGTVDSARRGLTNTRAISMKVEGTRSTAGKGSCFGLFPVPLPLAEFPQRLAVPLKALGLQV